MVELSHRDRTIKVKIVYYGPPVGGKTTNLQLLHQHAAANRRGEMISINSAQDRTILFDLLPLRTPGLRGFELRLQVLAVPGQAMYATTRRLVLKGADSLVFVANSAVDRWEENLQSFREMSQNLVSHRLDPSTMPMVFQYNKRDLPDIMDLEVMDRALNGRQADRIAAVAVRGEGVLETFSAILMRTVEEVCRRYKMLDSPGAQPAPMWTQQAVLGMFGTEALTRTAPPVAAPPPPAAAPLAAPAVPPVVSTAAPPPAPPLPRPDEERIPTRPVTPIRVTAVEPGPATPPTYRKVRVAPQPEDLLRSPASGPDARANETLVESYAEASEQLSSALNDLREERDLTRRRLEDLQKTLQAGQDILAGKPLQLSLETVLLRMAGVVGVEHAAFVLPQAGGRPPVVAVTYGLAEEPLLCVAAAWRQVAEAATREGPPLLHSVTESGELVQALERGREAFTAVLAVAFRTPHGLHALGTLYFPGDAALPSPDKLAHLGEISRALSAALELASTLETVRGAERALEMALAGTASLRGLEGVITELATVRDGLGGMRKRADAPLWLQEEIARLTPSLQSGLSVAHSLLAFSKGEIRREEVLIEDLLAELSSEQVSVRIAAGAETVSGDPALLKVALRSLIDHVRRPRAEGAGGRSVEVRAEPSGANVLVSVGTAGGAGKPADGSALGLSLARRVVELHGGSLTESAPGGFIVLSLPPR